jgi:4-hydroxyacetophenone monooxygenase
MIEPEHGYQNQLQAALAQADIRVLLMVVVHLTGDSRWLREPFLPKRDVRLIADPAAGLSSEVQEEIRTAAFVALSRRRVEPAIDRPDRSLLLKMMCVCLGEEVPEEYTLMMFQEMGFVPDLVPELGKPDVGEQLSAVVIGAGISGILAAIKLHAAGVAVTVLEKNKDIGGTWLENSYPDCGVDTPNHFYSYSFAPNSNWNHFFSLRAEIYAYLERCVDQFDIRKLITFGSTVDSAKWDDARQAWAVDYRSANGESSSVSARFLISAVGQLNRPQRPPIVGLDEFKGPVFHSAHWRHDVDLRGRSVGVIGAGASAMQFVPRIAPLAERLTIFQRSKQWARPIGEYRSSVSEEVKWLIRHVPYYSAWMRFTLAWRYGDGLHRHLKKDPTWAHPERSVNQGNDRHRVELTEYISQELGYDAGLISKTLPSYPPYAKRMLIDNGWFRTLTRANVQLVAEPIVSATKDALLTADGRHHHLEVLILATGFEAKSILGHVAIVGKDGVSLSERWGVDDARAYLGMTVPGFPNLFVLYGPNTNLGHGGSIIFHAECQLRYILSLVEQMVNGRYGAVEVRSEVHDAYNAAVDAAHESMIWTHPGVDPWYRNRAGRVVSNSPWRLVDYWNMTVEARLNDYHLDPVSADLLPAQPTG